MDRALNPKLEKETIYEIYRACRLCGAGAGYKMPIMQNVLDSDDAGLNLTQKIRECVQIEVHQDDKMPPLICELCVDKVNDFYEFLDMCRQTNKRTRLKLGLPLQNAPKEVQESTDCILGDTEPVYINSDSDVEPLSKHKSKPKAKDKTKESSKSKMKKELEYNINIENILTTDRSSRSCRVKSTPPAKSPPPPPRVTRTSSAASDNKSPDTSKKSKTLLKSIIKKEKEDEKMEDEEVSSLKRTREKEIKIEPVKKVKLIVEQSPAKSSPKSKSSSKKSHASPVAPAKCKPKHPTSPAPASYPAEEINTCPVCFQVTKTSMGYNNHMRTHVVTFTNAKLACNACGEWFSSSSETTAHHNWHKSNPYKCRRCTAQFQHAREYDGHFGSSQCIPYDEVGDVQCNECWRYFATDKLLIDHRCAGQDGRPGGKCPKCNRTYVLLKNLVRHQTTCLHRARTEPAACEVQVRLAKCDPLLLNTRGDHYIVTGDENFGYDEDCEYPYAKQIKVKPEPFEGMVKINEDLEKELLSQDEWRMDHSPATLETDSNIEERNSDSENRTKSDSDVDTANTKGNNETVEDKEKATLGVENRDQNRDLGDNSDINTNDFNGKEKLNGGVANNIDKDALDNGVTEKFVQDDSEFDSEIDGDKLIAALNEQIGEDDDDKHNGDGKHPEAKTPKLSLDELLTRDSKMDVENINDLKFDY